MKHVDAEADARFSDRRLHYWVFIYTSPLVVTAKNRNCVILVFFVSIAAVRLWRCSDQAFQVSSLGFAGQMLLDVCGRGSRNGLRMSGRHAGEHGKVLGLVEATVQINLGCMNSHALGS